MLKVEYGKTEGWEAAIRGARNPLNSWDKSDSGHMPEGDFLVGKNDLGLLMRLRNAGTDHRKFMRQIFVSCDITAPLYWWKEMDQYKIATVTDSCSTMHTITKKKLSREDFSCEHLVEDSLKVLDTIIEAVNAAIDVINNFDDWKDVLVEGITDKKDVWWQIIQLLPTSFNQKRTWTANYEVLANIYHARKDHKLDCWREFCKWIETLPYSELITGEQK